MSSGNIQTRLEISNGLQLDNVESAIIKMTASHAHDMNFSQDDFGNGYSPFAYLKRLPRDLNIDRE